MSIFIQRHFIILFFSSSSTHIYKPKYYNIFIFYSKFRSNNSISVNFYRNSLMNLQPYSPIPFQLWIIVIWDIYLNHFRRLINSLHLTNLYSRSIYQIIQTQIYIIFISITLSISLSTSLISTNGDSPKNVDFLFVYISQILTFSPLNIIYH